MKPVKLRLKIDLVSYPARAEGLVNMVNTEEIVSSNCYLINGSLIELATLQQQREGESFTEGVLRFEGQELISVCDQITGRKVPLDGAV